MAVFVNEHDVLILLSRFSEDDKTPHLGLGAQVLYRLMDWTNNESRSDGWTYWAKPRQAAATLIGMLNDAAAQHRNGTLFDDIRETDLNRALRPIKAFLTKQGIDWNADLPWAALFPAT